MAIIHNHIIDTKTNNHILIVETAGSRGGRQWIHPSILRTIRVSEDVALKIARGQIHRFSQSAITVIEEWEVDGRYRGERSAYSKTLTAMRDEIYDHVDDKGRAVQGPSHGSADELKAFLEKIRLQNALNELPLYDAKSGEFRNRLI